MADGKTRATIREFLVNKTRNDAIRDDDDIFGTGMVNSLFAVEIVCFIEETFGITVENEDLDVANFRSVEALTGFVERKAPTK